MHKQKKILLYVVAFILLTTILLFFNRAYRELSNYASLTHRHNAVHSAFQNLSRQLNNAAVINPDLIKTGNVSNAGNLFFTDSLSIIQQVTQLKSLVRDSINIQIVEKLEPAIRSELSWLLSSNVPDSIMHNRATGHIAAFKRTDSLVSEGIKRTIFLVGQREEQLEDEIARIRMWMIIFILVSGLLLIIATTSFFRQRSRSKRKEEELEIAFNRISDGVISLNKRWQYTFINDAVLAIDPTHGRERLGKVIWDVHPEMKGTIFWDKYHEAMLTKKEVEVESFYAPLDVWFSVKMYPSEDGLTVFYKDVSESKKAELELLKTSKEVTDYKFALDESSIVAVTDQKGVIQHANDNFCKISKYSREELIGQDHRIINSGYHPKEFIKNLWVTIANGKIWKGELKNKAKDGTIYWVDTTIVPFLNEEGKPYQYVAIRSDITERKLAEEHLKRSLKEIADYKYALEESSIVAITDQKGIIQYANDNFCSISKYSREELVGQDHRIINSGYHPKEFIKDLWVTIANGKIWKGELKNKAKDGTIYWVDTTIVPFLNEEGKPYQYVAIRSDITERKLAEEHLKQSLKEIADYKYALEESSIVAITDQKGIIQYANDNFCTISKYSREELVGQDHRIINSGYHPKEFIKNLWVTIANGKIWKGELKNKAKDGTIYWVDTTIVPFLDDKGKPYQYIAIRADITERKEVEEKLVQSQKIYKTIASSIPGTVICLFDSDFRYLLIEGDMLEKLGYSKAALLGNKAEDVLPPETFAYVKEEFKKVLAGITVTRETNRLGYDIISRYIPLKDEHNIVYAIMTVAIDVTQLKTAHRNIAELNRSLEEKIAARTIELRKSNEELETFSYSVSHDLRAPLRGALAFATILDEEYGTKLDDEARRIIGIIKESTLKMGNLIDDLLAFSRMGKQGINKIPVDTRMVVDAIIHDLVQQTNKDHINWNILELPTVNADVNMIRQVWINLLSNAIKYTGTKENPRVEIGSYAADGQIVFYIKDNGVGFDEEFKDKLFKVFQRLHDEEEFEGTGVGLALVEKIISRHEGKVWAEGKEDEGACFYFSLPA